jgi:hypothetical protein
MATPSQAGSRQDGAVTSLARDFPRQGELGLVAGGCVLHMDRTGVDHGTPHHRAASQGEALNRCPLSAADEAVMSHEGKLAALHQVNHPVRRPADPSGILRDGPQHRPEVRRRARDHAQDLGCRRLLLQGLLRFIEQPHVLDGDDGLVGEGLEERDLRVREAAGLPAADIDGADDPALSQHRHGDQAAVAEHVSGLTRELDNGRLQDIWHVDN